MYKDINVKTVKLPKNLVDRLERIPEDGIGYHILDIELTNGKVLKKRLVANGEFLLLKPKEEIRTEEIKSYIL